jgi:hypothetical protein
MILRAGRGLSRLHFTASVGCGYLSARFPKRHAMAFIILTQARSGSYHLAALLNSAPDITCFGEIFKENALELPKAQLDQLGLTNRDMAARDADGMALLNRLRKPIETEGQIFGFKDFLFNLRRAKIFGKIAHSTGWKKIVLLRNPLERYVSRIRAAETGIFVVKQGDSHAPDRLHQPIRFAPESFEPFLQAHTRFVETAETLREKHGEGAVFFAQYERLSEPAHLQAILAFLGSDARAEALTSAHVKQFEQPLAQGVENWDELLTYLSAHNLTQLLPEG